MDGWIQLPKERENVFYLWEENNSPDAVYQHKKTYDFHPVFCHSTVNLEIFARVLFSRNFAYAKFSENEMKSSRIGEITLSFTDIGI